MIDFDFLKSAVYVGTYGKYNAGSIYGKWLKLSEFSAKDEFLEACRELHSDEDDPELMFQDWEYIPDPFICESYISEKWWELFDACDGNDDNMRKVVDYINVFWGGCSICDLDMYDMMRKAEDSCCCDVADWHDYVDSLADEYLASFPGFDSCYFDYERFEDNLRHDYTFGSFYCFMN